MTDDIASLRATIERLTAERDEERERHRLKLTAIEVAAGCNTLESARKQRINPSNQYWTSAYAATFEAVAREMRERARADDAEATIARLGMVVRAAEEYRDRGWKHSGRFESFVAVRAAYDAALSSLTPEDRRRAGIEG